MGCGGDAATGLGCVAFCVTEVTQEDTCTGAAIGCCGAKCRTASMRVASGLGLKWPVMDVE